MIVNYKITRIVLALAVLFYGSTAVAEDYRIGVVDDVRLLEAAPQMEAARKRIDTEFSPRDRELVDMRKALKRLEIDLDKNGATMSADAKRKAEREIRTNKREIKRMTDEFREDLIFRRNEEFSKLQRLIIEAIQEVAKMNKYDLVVGEGVVLFAGEKVDFTNKVLEYLQQRGSDAAKSASKK